MQTSAIYSSFFSSGLHNVNQTQEALDIDLELSEPETESSTSTLGQGGYSDSNYSPSRASSPIPIPPERDFLAPNDNDMDVDSTFSAYSSTSSSGEPTVGRRSVTPTLSRQTTPVPLRTQTSSHRLRARRSKSSLTQSLTSPKAIHAIKSPNRAASNARSLQLQIHQLHSRHNLSAGSEGDGQSGAPPLLSFKPRRLFSFARRRHVSMPIPAALPPPAMPLPALPLQVQEPLLSPSPLEESTQHNLLLSAFKSDTKFVNMPFGRRRGLSRSTLAADGHRIDEIDDMKEN